MLLSLAVPSALKALGALLSLLLNVLLTVVIVVYTRREIGSYKWLMLVMSVNYVVCSVLMASALPTYMAHDSAFIIMCGNPLCQWWPSLGQRLTDAEIMLFMTSYMLIAINFFYRCSVVCWPRFLTTFAGAKTCLWVSLVLAYSAFGGALITLVFAPSDDIMLIIRNATLEVYNVDVATTPYCGVNYIIQADSESAGKFESPNWTQIAAITVIVIASGALLGVSAFCGVKTWDGIQALSDTVSPRTTQLQKQLFFAVVAQFVVPLSLFYVPLSAGSLLPVLRLPRVRVDFCALTCWHPACDAVAVIFIISDYRHSLRASIVKWLAHAVVPSTSTRSFVHTV